MIPLFAQISKTRTLRHCEYCDISNNTYLEEHLVRLRLKIIGKSTIDNDHYMINMDVKGQKFPLIDC